MRDPMKFQDFIRSQKRRADNNLRDNDMQWDYWSLSPESAHQVTWLMGDRGIPRSWRNMDGFSSHTYMWVNAGGEKFWVRYHFKTNQGIEFLTQAEADRLAGTDGDYHTRDLWRAIERGDYPSWTLKMQIMPFGAVCSPTPTPSGTGSGRTTTNSPSMRPRSRCTVMPRTDTCDTTTPGTPSTPPIPRAARGRTRNASVNRPAGKATARWCGPPRPCTPKMTISGNREPFKIDANIGDRIETGVRSGQQH